MRTLIVRPGAIGDALLTFPIINILRKQDVNPHVTLVSNPAVLPVAQAFGLAEELYNYDHPRWSELFSPSGISSSTLRDLLRQTDRAICWLTDSDGIVQHNLLRAGIASVTVKPGRPPQEQQHLHQVVYLAETLGLPPIDVTAPFVPPSPLSPSPHPAGKTIAIHPGSGSASKCWPVTHFTALIDKLRARGVPILLLAGPADHERLGTILDALVLRHRDQRGMGSPIHHSTPLAPTNIAGYIQGTLLRTLVDAPLLDVAYQLQQCRCYIGNDSGLTHLSAMLGIPTIAIFGPTDPAHWRPPGPTVRVIRAQPLEQLTVETVMGTIEAS